MHCLNVYSQTMICVHFVLRTKCIADVSTETRHINKMAASTGRSVITQEGGVQPQDGRASVSMASTVSLQKNFITLFGNVTVMKRSTHTHTHTRVTADWTIRL